MSAECRSPTSSRRARPPEPPRALHRARRAVFCNALGRPLDGSALRRRYRRAQDAAEVRPLRFHDLRHTFGSLLAARGVDVVTIQSAMGHSALSTTSRYLHARPASEQAQAFTAAFAPEIATPESVAG